MLDIVHKNIEESDRNHKQYQDRGHGYQIQIPTNIQQWTIAKRDWYTKNPSQKVRDSDVDENNADKFLPIVAVHILLHRHLSEEHPDAVFVRLDSQNLQLRRVLFHDDHQVQQGVLKTLALAGVVFGELGLAESLSYEIKLPKCFRLQLDKNEEHDVTIL